MRFGKALLKPSCRRDMFDLYGGSEKKTSTWDLLVLWWLRHSPVYVGINDFQLLRNSGKDN